MFERIRMLIHFFRIVFFVYFVTKMLFDVVYGLWLRVRCFVCFRIWCVSYLMNNKFNLIDNDPFRWNVFFFIDNNSRDHRNVAYGSPLKSNKPPKILANITTYALECKSLWTVLWTNYQKYSPAKLSSSLEPN